VSVEVNVGEVHSTVRATDGTTLLAPEVLEGIVRAVLERLREEEQHQSRVEAERRLTPGIMADARKEDWR
jgi:hypothetical protein